MTLRLSLLIGLRFSRGCRHSGVVSLVYVISIVSIALGVAVLIIGLSATHGFERELNERILAMVPHGEIESIDQPWNNWSDALIKVKKVPGIILATPYINFTGLVESKLNLCVIQIIGVNPQQETYLDVLIKFMQNNAWVNFQDGKQQIIIGKGVADTLNIKQGDWVSIMIPNIGVNHKLQQPKHMRLHVTGIFQSGSQLDRNFAMISINDARKYLGIGNTINGIAIKVDDIFNADKLVRYAGEAVNSHVHIKSWISTYGYMYRDIQMIRTIMYLAMILVIGVACFNIVSMLIIEVQNKSRDIAILRTLGAKNSLIYAIFIWYGLITGLLGSLCGAIIGVIVSIQLTSIIKGIEKLIGHQFLSGDVYFIDFLPSKLDGQDVIYVLITVILLSLLASWYPAYRASCIDPVVSLSNRNSVL